MNPDLLLGVDALLMALIAAVIDVRQHRIPNWLTYSGIGMGIVLRWAFFGWPGLSSAATGCLLAGGVVFLFYLVRAMGAGDVKLLAAIGSLVGPSHAVSILVATAIGGGVLAICYVAYRGRMWATVKNIGSVLKFHSGSGLQVHPELNLDNPSALRMPYGLAIASGTMYAFLANWWR